MEEEKPKEGKGEGEGGGGGGGGKKRRKNPVCRDYLRNVCKRNKHCKFTHPVGRKGSEGFCGGVYVDFDRPIIHELQLQLQDSRFPPPPSDWLDWLENSENCDWRCVKPCLGKNNMNLRPDPVCGTDHFEYYNYCRLEVFICTAHYRGRKLALKHLGKCAPWEIRNPKQLPPLFQGFSMFQQQGRYWQGL